MACRRTLEWGYSKRNLFTFRIQQSTIITDKPCSLCQLEGHITWKSLLHFMRNHKKAQKSQQIKKRITKITSKASKIHKNHKSLINFSMSDTLAFNDKPKHCQRLLLNVGEGRHTSAPLLQHAPGPWIVLVNKLRNIARPFKTAKVLILGNCHKVWSRKDSTVSPEPLRGKCWANKLFHTEKMGDQIIILDRRLRSAGQYLFIR